MALSSTALPVVSLEGLLRVALGAAVQVEDAEGSLALVQLVFTVGPNAFDQFLKCCGKKMLLFC